MAPSQKSVFAAIISNSNQPLHGCLNLQLHIYMRRMKFNLSHDNELENGTKQQKHSILKYFSSETLQSINIP